MKKQVQEQNTFAGQPMRSAEANAAARVVQAGAILFGALLIATVLAQWRIAHADSACSEFAYQTNLAWRAYADEQADPSNYESNQANDEIMDKALTVAQQAVDTASGLNPCMKYLSDETGSKFFTLHAWRRFHNSDPGTAAGAKALADGMASDLKMALLYHADRGQTSTLYDLDMGVLKIARKGPVK